MATTYTSPFALAGCQQHLGSPTARLAGKDQDIMRLMEASQYRAVRSARRQTMRGGPTELDDLLKMDMEMASHFTTQCFVTVTTGTAALGQEKQW